MAIREGWRAASELALERVVHGQRTSDLEALKPLEQRDLYLKALGYRYLQAMLAHTANRNPPTGELLTPREVD